MIAPGVLSPGQQVHRITGKRGSVLMDHKVRSGEVVGRSCIGVVAVGGERLQSVVNHHVVLFEGRRIGMRGWVGELCGQLLVGMLSMLLRRGRPLLSMLLAVGTPKNMGLWP